MFNKFKKSLGSVFSKTLNEGNMEGILQELKIILIKNDVGVQVSEEICNEIEKNFSGEKVGLFSKKNVLKNAFQEAVSTILHVEEEDKLDLVGLIKTKHENKKEPYVIMVLGVNGTGKTTTIAKLVNLFKKNDIESVVAASDTFRAGAIEQLGRHMKNLDTRIIKREYNADPSSVAWDAIDHARAKNKACVIIDTSGRQVNNKNLLEELKKIKRVNEPDLTLFIGDSLAGNDVIYQCTEFNRIVGIDASILTKIDADAKGGSAISTMHITKAPILYLGVGQGYDDLVEFNPEWLIKKIFGL